MAGKARLVIKAGKAIRKALKKKPKVKVKKKREPHVGRVVKGRPKKTPKSKKTDAQVDYKIQRHMERHDPELRRKKFEKEHFENLKRDHRGEGRIFSKDKDPAVKSRVEAERKKLLKIRLKDRLKRKQKESMKVIKGGKKEK